MSEADLSGKAESERSAAHASHGIEDAEAPPGWFTGAVRLLASRLVVSLIVATLGTILLLTLISRLRGLIGILVTALFMSFAIEPAVNRLAARGWRRGVATALVFLVVVVGFVLLFLLVIPAVVQGFQQIAAVAPQWLAKIQQWAAKIGIDVSTQRLSEEIQQNAANIASHAFDLLGGLIGLGATVLSRIFRWTTIGLFTFYIVAEGPRLRRTVCRALPPSRQQQVLFVWEKAIATTGGYFYSRLLLAIVNGTGMYIVLRLTDVPFAAPLAIFVGVVAEFIPTIGTYIAGAAPVAAALLVSVNAALWVLGYILVYQQLENFVISPRLTARTMKLHPAVAFGAAMVGGAIGGILMAFLALPAAAVIQAAVQEYGHQYKVVVPTELTTEAAPRSRRPFLSRKGS
jgi:predicted PurR-regulated permease PerM